MSKRVFTNERETGKDLRDNILREQVNLTVQHLPTMQSASFIVALVLAFLVRKSVFHLNIVLWIAMVLLVVVSRIIFFIRFVKLRKTPFDGHYWGNVFVALALISGIIWGLSAFIIFPAGNQGLIALFVLVMASLSASTLGSHSALRFCPAAWAGPVMLLYAIRCFMEGGEFGYALSFLVVLYLGTILRYSFNLNSAISSAISLKFENLELLEDVRKAGEALEKKVDERTAELQQVNESLIQQFEERRRSEDEVRRAKEFLENVFKTSGDGLIVTDAHGYIVRINNKALQLFGYPEQEMLGKHIAEFAADNYNDYADMPPNMELLLKKDFIENYESEHQRKDGTWFTAERNIIIMKDGEGSPVGAVASIRDITERKKAEKKLTNLASAIEQAEEMIFILDASGAIEYANPAVEKIGGFHREELLGKTPFSGKRGVYDRGFTGPVWGKINAGHTWSGHISETKKDGSPCEIDLTIAPVRDATGAIVNFVAIGRDVTRELKMEARLRQSQKMEAIGTLAGGIAHDFNNILGAILGYAELSLDETEEGSSVEYNLKQILKSSMRARDLVRQILAFSRKDMEGRKPVNINSIIKEAVRLLRASLPSTIEIRTHISEQAGMVNSNPTQLHQLLMNLCTNAAQAMSGNGGQLVIALTPVFLAEGDSAVNPDMHPGPYVQLTVRDTGTGIDPKIIDRIYDPFFTTKEVGKGTGMGLAVVHGIVKSHEGSIQVESEPGRGSTFNVLLPAVAAQPQEHREEEKPLPRGSERILFIDDEKNLIDVGKGQLESLGYRVTAMQSSLEALDVFQKDPPAFDLVITDQTMPGITGDNLAKKLMAVRADIPVILCSGYTELVSEDRVRELGIKAFLMKPLKRREMAQVIRNILDDKAN